MANRNIDENIRKPRRTRGTPFNTQRNYYALGVLAVGGLSLVAYELWPETRKLKAALAEGKLLQDPPVIQNKFLETRLRIENPVYDQLINKLRHRQKEREDAEYYGRPEDQAKPQPWYVKVFSSHPE